MSVDLSVILAVQGSAARLPGVLAALAAQCDAGVEVLVCYAAEEHTAPESCRPYPWARPHAGARGALVPQLWRDGLLEARADRVALTIAHCRPRPDWIARLREADLVNAAGVGGALENAADSDALGWATFLLRYLPYTPPFAAHDARDLAGDNAVYDRKALLAHAPAFADGFWEPEIHALLLAEGRVLRLDPALCVEHDNAYTTLGFARQRLLHGTRFGFDRARRMTATRRIVQLVFAPAVPLVFGRKIVLAAWKRPELRPKLARAAPHLLFFLCAWALGEARGTLRAMRGSGE